MCFPLTFAPNGLGKVVVWSLKHSRSKHRGRKHSNNMLRSWRFTGDQSCELLIYSISQVNFSFFP